MIGDDNRSSEGEKTSREQRVPDKCGVSKREGFGIGHLRLNAPITPSSCVHLRSG